MTVADTNRDQQVSTRRRMLTRISAALVTMGLGKATASTPSGGLKSVQIRDVARIDAAGGDGWLARDHSGRLWQVLEDGSTRLLGEGLAAEGALNARHGRIAGRSIDGHLWVRSDAAASAGADALAADVAVAAAPDGGPDASAPDSVASGDGAVPVVDKTAGAMVTTEPTGATVLRDKKKLCTTPCLVTWTPEEQPPIVRISQKGYIDIDLQFVNADRGTDQHLELRKQP